jgi:hypothetical protein
MTEPALRTLWDVPSSVDVDIKFPGRYPKTAPIVELVNCKGLSTQQITTLNHEVSEQLKALEGREMVPVLILFFFVE